MRTRGSLDLDPHATGALVRRFGSVVGLLTVVALTSGCSSPAPQGDSASTSASAGAGLTLLVLGDSIASGGESGTDASFAPQYAALIEKKTRKTVRVENLADPAETSTSLLTKIRSDDGVRAAVAAADVVTVSVGGNDSDPFAAHDTDACAPGGDAAACLSDYAPDLETNLDGILTGIATLRKGAPTVVRLTSPDYDPFIGVTAIDGVASLPKGFGLDFYRQVAAAMTAAACRVAKAHQADCADILHVFNGADGDQPATAYLADDHLHPSEHGEQAIADTLLATGLQPLR